MVAFTLGQLVNNPDPEVARAAAHVARYVSDTGVSDSLLQLPVHQLLEQLVDQRTDASEEVTSAVDQRADVSEIVSDDPQIDFPRLDDVTLSLTTIIRRLFSAGPYGIVQDHPTGPRSLDLPTMQDLQEGHLKGEVSSLLGVEYLSPVPPLVSGGVWPVQGALYGPYHRPLVCLPTQLRPGMPCVAVIFLVDTGAPNTELSPAAFAALGGLRPSGLAGQPEVPPRVAQGIVNGVHCQLQLCAPHGNRPHIPVLGANYLIAMQGVVNVNYKRGGVSIARA